MNKFILTVLILLVLPSMSWACACGCGVFDVGTSSMFQMSPGGMIYEEYDFMDQDQNWQHSSKASADDNSDKQIRTSFMTTGFQYFFNRQWGFSAELPFDHRHFKTDTGDVGMPDIQSFNHDAIGDIRLRGIYTGLSQDMSTGLEFGLKLPTGDYTYPNFDRDTELGTGSTDALLGFYHMGSITDAVGYFVQDSLDQPFLTHGGYRPGTEDDAAAGLYYNGISVAGLKVAPIAEVENSYRSKDRGWAADPTDSGYERILLTPGIELDYKNVMVFFDVGFPVYQYVNGNQLISKELYKVSVAYKF